MAKETLPLVLGGHSFIAELGNDEAEAEWLTGLLARVPREG